MRKMCLLMLSLTLIAVIASLKGFVICQEQIPIALTLSRTYQSIMVEDWGINRLIKDGLIEEVESQIAHGFDVNSTDQFGWTPLMYACLWKEAGIARMLIENGSDVRAMSPQGVSPLLIAVSYENVPLIKLLLDYGAPINSKIECKEQPKDRFSSIAKPMFDLRYFSKLVLNNGAPYPIENCNSTSLIFAAHYCKSISVRELTLRRAAIDERDEKGATALMKAGYGAMPVDIQAGCGAEISALLLKHGANINTKDKNGFTPLMYAIQSLDEAKVKTLLSNGADVSITSEDGSTALSLANIRGNTTIINLVSKALESNTIRK